MNNNHPGVFGITARCFHCVALQQQEATTTVSKDVPKATGYTSRKRKDNKTQSESKTCTVT